MTKKILVIGAGPAGYVAALHAARLGAQVTLIGGHDLGGTCLQRGCIPTKTLVSACKALRTIQRSSEHGLQLEGSVRADWGELRARMTKVSGINEKGIRELLKHEGVEIVPGIARIVASDSVEVGGQHFRGDRILLCTGSRPWLPPGLTLPEGSFSTSDDVLAWDSLPQSVAIVGGGVIACEFAFILRALGCDVVVLEQQDRPIPNEDRDCSQLLLREMKKRRIRFIGGVTLTAVSREDDQLLCRNEDGVVAQADRVVVAVGRVPNCDQLFTEQAPVARGARGEVLVDEHGRTSVAGIYAAGDVTGQMMLAHAASAQARHAVDHMLGGATGRFDPNCIPRVTYTDPEVASVGLTEAQAQEQHGECMVGRFDLRALGMAHAMNELSGFAKVVADSRDRRLLGVHIVGAHASEMIHEAVALISQGASIDALATSVHAHPTLSEAVAEAADDALGHCLHKPSRKPPEEDIVHASADRLSVS